MSYCELVSLSSFIISLKPCLLDLLGCLLNSNTCDLIYIYIYLFRYIGNTVVGSECLPRCPNRSVAAQCFAPNIGRGWTCILLAER